MFNTLFFGRVKEFINHMLSKCHDSNLSVNETELLLSPATVVLCKEITGSCKYQSLVLTVLPTPVFTLGLLRLVQKRPRPVWKERGVRGLERAAALLTGSDRRTVLWASVMWEIPAGSALSFRCVEFLITILGILVSWIFRMSLIMKKCVVKGNCECWTF